MRASIGRFANIIVRPEEEWSRIARDAESPLRLVFFVIAPLAAIPPLAFAWQAIAGRGASVGGALSTAMAGIASEVAGVVLVAAVIWLISPIYRTPRDFSAGLRVVAYAAVPVWLAGIVLAAPLQEFPLFTIILLIGLMHALYLFYVGLHRVARVPRAEAAECAGVVVLASFFVSTVVGYYGSAAGLFPKVG